MNHETTIDVIANKTRYCFMEFNGCGAPLTLKISMNKEAGYPDNADL